MIRSSRLIAGLALIILLVWYSGARPSDSTPTPMDSIPRLPETFEPIDFKTALANGVLLPDRIYVGAALVQTGMTESAAIARLPDTGRVLGEPEERTREQQWQYIRSLLAKNNFSMQYYILAAIYYDRQLSGRFKTDEWTIDGVGKLTLHLFEDNADDGFRIWLIQLAMEPESVDRIKYEKEQENELVRSGSPEVRWNIRWNWVMIAPDS